MAFDNYNRNAHNAALGRARSAATLDRQRLVTSVLRSHMDAGTQLPATPSRCDCGQRRRPTCGHVALLKALVADESHGGNSQLAWSCSKALLNRAAKAAAGW